MNEQSTATVRDNEQRSRFEVEVDGRVAGFIDYRDQDGVLALVHTEVDPAYEGQGLAGQLAQHALEAARRSGRKVVPSCSYVAAYIRRHGEHADLVAG
ncbi:MAG TPA: GNAT family N-acetyltransferase [Ramlibacter sp.]|jgi:predicted GNAT family acetyltransferase|uniref:GNAT family N-acetyltransferase n=1 Tax=Ramlibacter sp. TaxID=1917967 RepID=UPI002D59D734|nr:GNAT family N-acetyltransferase [Ramlibacter sp.]HZY17889.1 GNAT family N-acetyltransferase [Ramlibacter sp.]